MNNKPAARSEQGMALLLVILIVTCITIISFGFLSMVKAQERQTSIFVDRNSGGYYAEAGVNQYIWDLNQNDNYYTSHPTVAGEYENGYYSMNVTPPGPGDPTVTVDATGWTARDPQNPTTIEYKLKKRQFTNYVFCSNNEITDDGQANYWGTGDEVHNKIHTNGNYNFYGSPGARFDDTATFSGVATYTANNFNSCTPDDGPQFYLGSGSGAQQSTWQNQCYYEGVLQWPQSNTQLQTLAQYSGGLYFPHRTSLYLHDDNENPPQTVIDAYYWDGTQWQYKTNLPLPSNGVIYVDGSTTFSGVSTNEQQLTRPDYEGGSPYLNYANQFVNALQNTPNPLVVPEIDKFNPDRGNVFVSGVLRGQLTIACSNNIYLCPTDPTHPFVPYDPLHPTKWPASPGIVYGGTTFNSDGSVNNLASNDMLGLIATGYVRIIHNFWPSTPFDSTVYTPTALEEQYCCDLHDTNLEPDSSTGFGGFNIDAAIFALKWDFEYEDYWQDNNKGHINLIGSMTQYYRGAEGVIRGSGTASTNGYNDNYWHDARMDYDTPPHFLSPLNAGWGVVSWRQLPNGQAAFAPVTSISVGGFGGSSSCDTLQSLQMTATVSPANATNQNLLWSIADSDGAQATIDEDSGLLLAGPTSGLAQVTATAEDGSGVAASCNIAIGTFTPVSSIVVTDLNGGTMQVNSTLQMEYAIHPGSGDSPYTNYSGTGDPQPWASTPGVTWKVYDPAGTGSRIDMNSGILTAGNLPGTVTVMATAIDGSQVTGTENVTVTPSS